MASIEQTGLLQRINELTEHSAKDTGIEIAEVQLKGAGKARLLRVYIDKPGGVTHGDCQLISERLGALLDAEDAIPDDSYTLEVSSPGVERKLSKVRDFERVAGQKVRVAVKEAIDGQLRFEGKVVRCTDGLLVLEMQPGLSAEIPLDRIQKANLKFEW